MKTYTQEELKEILEKHCKWLKHEEGGERANLSDTDLSGLSLSDVDLSFANLRSANLMRTDLSCAKLIHANLSGANLSGTILNCANLRSTDLRHAILNDTKLLGTNLRSADLRESTLSGISQNYADLSGTVLNDATSDKKYVAIACVGNHQDSMTYCFDDDTVWCDCYRGSLTTFATEIKDIYKDKPQHIREYRAAITYIEMLKKLYKT